MIANPNNVIPTDVIIPSSVSHLSGYDRQGQGSNRTSSGNQPAKPKFVAKGHDAQLQDAQFNKIPVVITTMAGERFNGQVLKRDKFTITLRYPSIDAEEIFFKHAIERVQLLRNKQEA